MKLLKRKKAFFFILLVCLFSFLHAEVLTLSKSIEMAINSNTELKKQQIVLADAQRKNNNAWNKFLPSLSATGNISNAHDFEDSSVWSWRATAGASLSFSFAIPSTIQQLQLTYLVEKTAYDKLLATTEASVSTNFYNLITTERNLAILKDSQTLAKNVYEQTLKNYNNGLASELDLLKSQYSYLSIQPDIEETQSTYKSQLASFALQIGLENTEGMSLQGDISLQKVTFPTIDELCSTYLENRFDVIQSDLSLKQTELTSNSQNASSKLPSFTLSENLTLSENTVSDSPLANLNGTFSVGVNIPISSLIPFSSEYLDSKTYKDNITKAQMTCEETRKTAKNDIQEKVDSVNRLWETLDVSKLNVSIAQRSYELSQEGYQSGLISQTDLESSRQQMLSAQQSYLQTQIQYLSAIYNAAQSLNLSISDFYSTFGGTK